MPTPAVTKPPVATSVDTSAESATTRLYRAAIGPINNDYYLPIFTRFEAVDRAGLSWNSAASLYTLNWLVFRQLWRVAGLYAAAVLGAALLLLGAGFLLQLPESTEWSLWLAWIVLSFVVPGLYGNAWLHAASRTKMASALTASATLREACALLNQQASSRQRFIRMGVVNLVLAGVAVGAYLVFSQRGPVKPVTSTVGEVRHQNVGKITIESAPVAPAASSGATPVSMAASAAPAPAPPLVQDPAYLDAMAAATSRYVPRRPVIIDAKPETEVAPAPASKRIDANGKEKSKASGKDAAAEQPYAINVGLFANGANALNAYTKLVDAGLAASMQEVKTANGQRTRVRVGPFSNRAEADVAVKKILTLQLEAVRVQSP